MLPFAFCSLLVYGCAILCAIVPCAVLFLKSLKALWNMVVCHSSIFFCNLLRIEKFFYIDTIYSTCHIMLR